MKRNKFAISALLSVLLVTVFVLAACSQPEAVSDALVSDTSPQLEAISDALVTDTSSQPEVIPDAPATDTLDNALTAVISSESFDALRANMFMGGGVEIGPGAGGDEMEWYRTVFGFLPNGVDRHFIDLVGEGAFTRWTALPRYRREPALISFIEYFNITMDDMVRAQTNAHGLPEHEIEALISWARYGEDTGFTDPDNEMIWADLVFSRSDFEALFSGDVNQLWAAFPGHGVVHNGRAYTAEWILNNISAAVLEEQIPMGEIERMIELATDFEQLAYVVSSAQSSLQAAAS